ASLRDGMRAFRGTTLISARRASAPSSSPWITAGSRHGLQGPGGPFSLRLQGELRRRVPCRLAPAGGSLERDVPAYFSPSSSFLQGDTPSIDSLVYHDAAGWSILPAPGGPVAGPRFAAVPARPPRGAIEAADPQQCQVHDARHKEHHSGRDGRQEAHDLPGAKAEGRKAGDPDEDGKQDQQGRDEAHDPHPGSPPSPRPERA